MNKTAKRMYVRIVAAIFSLLLLPLLSSSGATAAGFTVVVNGTEVPGAAAELRNGQLMVALRPFAQAMGGNVEWLASDRRAIVRIGGTEVAFWTGSTTVFQDGKRLAAPVAPFLKQGRLMVPAWWLSVRLGAAVRFTGTTLYVDTAGAPGVKPLPTPQQGHPLMKSSYLFPFPAGVTYDPYFDSWGEGRSYEGQQSVHEGTDIMAAKGTRLVSVAAGKVVRYGWNTLGGYRLTIELDEFPQYRFYYAHMDRYAPNLYLGARVAAGQLLGYVGNTGEGPERTEGRFITHLHFGIYGPDGAINPFHFLKYWERNKINL